MNAPSNSNLVERVTRPLIVGVLGLLPLAITLGVLAWMVGFLHDLAGPESAFGSLLRSIGLSVVSSEVIAYLIGLLSTLAVVYLIGVLLQSGATKRFESAMEGTLQQLPVVSSIYETSKHLRSMFERKDAVIIPTAPVPFGGALLYVPAKWVKPAECSVRGLVSIYMSMGVSSAEQLSGRAEGSDDSSTTPTPDRGTN